MNASIDAWKHQLAALPSDDRLELAHFLLSSIEPDDSGAEAAWDAEALRRAVEIRGGTADGRPIDDLLAELRETYP